MEWLSSLVTGGLAGLIKILLDYLYEKIESEARAYFKEQGLQASDKEVAEKADARLKEMLGFDIKGKTIEEVDAKSEEAWNDYFNKLDH